jgi:hypothetical protein
MVASTDPMVVVGLRTWIARLRTDHAAISRVNGSKISNAVAAASGVTVVVEDLAEETVLAVGDSVAVIALVAADLVAEAALADSAAAGEANDRNKDSESHILFSKN